MSGNYAEFSNPKLAQIYDVFNTLTDDEGFWLEQIKELDISHITDLGSGTGLLTCKLAELGYQITGIEPAQAMLDIAKNKPYADSVQWLQGSYERLGFLDTDLVLMTSHVAQFFLEDEQWEGFLQKAFHAIKLGGYILFDSKNPSLEPWKNWTKKSTFRNKNTNQGEVDMWIELKSISGNYTEHEIHYLFRKTGEELISRNKLIYRTKENIESSLKNNDFSILNIFGNWKGDSFDSQSPEMIFLAQKIN